MTQKNDADKDGIDQKQVSKAGSTDDRTSVPPVYKTEERDLVDAKDKPRVGKRPIHVRVAVRQGESVDQMLRRFNFAVSKSDVIQRLKDLQFYEKPSKKRQREEKLRMSQGHRYNE